MKEFTLTFEPKWKEELVCSCERGEFVLDMPMGVVSVDFPTQEIWLESAPLWAKSHWVAVRRQLEDWCRSQQIPLHIGAFGRVY